MGIGLLLVRVGNHMRVVFTVIVSVVCRTVNMYAAAKKDGNEMDANQPHSPGLRDEIGMAVLHTAPHPIRHGSECRTSRQMLSILMIDITGRSVYINVTG